MSDSDRGAPVVGSGSGAGPTPVAPPPPPVNRPDPNAGGRIAGFSFANVARGLKIAALLLFLLPWVTVSCAEQTLVSMSGLDLATGSVTVHNPMTGETASPPSDANGPDMPVIVAAILIVVALMLSFVLRRRVGAFASMAALAGAAALIGYSVLYRIPAKAREDVTQQSGPTTQGIDQAQLAQMIRVETEIGFWLTLAAIIGAIVLTWMALRRAPPG